MVSLAHFAVMLVNHDWYFMMSDDQAVWRRGSEAATRLKQISVQSTEHYFLYHYYSTKGSIRHAGLTV